MTLKEAIIDHMKTHKDLNDKQAETLAGFVEGILKCLDALAHSDIPKHEIISCIMSTSLSMMSHPVVTQDKHAFDHLEKAISCIGMIAEVMCPTKEQSTSEIQKILSQCTHETKH